MLFSSHSPFLLAQPLAVMNQLSISIDLPIVEISYKWNHTVVSSHLIGFFIGIIFEKIIHIVLHFYCCSIYCTSFLFVAILWRMLFIHSLIDRHLGCFYFLAFMMMPYECLCLHFSVDMCLNSLRYTSEGRIARPCGNSVFSITKIKPQNKTKKTPANLFSKVSAAFYIPISRVWEFQCLHFSPTLVHFRYYSHCCGMKPFFISGSCI